MSTAIPLLYLCFTFGLWGDLYLYLYICLSTLAWRHME